MATERSSSVSSLFYDTVEEEVESCCAGAAMHASSPTGVCQQRAAAPSLSISEGRPTTLSRGTPALSSSTQPAPARTSDVRSSWPPPQSRLASFAAAAAPATPPPSQFDSPPLLLDDDDRETVSQWALARKHLES